MKGNEREVMGHVFLFARLVLMAAVVLCSAVAVATLSLLGAMCLSKALLIIYPQ
jgi:hypothetical protein